MRGSARAAAVLAVIVGAETLVLSGCARQRADFVHPIGKGPVPSMTRRPPTVAEEVAHAMRRAGAPIKVTRHFTAEGDPDGLLGKPGGYTAKAAFMDLELDSPKRRGHSVFDLIWGGWVEVFPSGLAARERAVRLQSARPGGEYDIVSGRVLVRVSPLVAEESVRAYERYVHKATGDPVRRIRPA